MFSIDLILKIIDFLFARGFDAARWAQRRQAVKAQLEAWHGSNATDEEKIATLDVLVSDIESASDVIQGSAPQTTGD